MIFWWTIFSCPLFLFGGMIVEISGIDGSGKTTFAEDLKTALEAKGHKVAVLRTQSGSPEIYALLDRFNCLEDESFYHRKRLERLKSDYFFLAFLSCKNDLEKLHKENDFLILDRYLHSFRIYQICSGQYFSEDEIMLRDFPQANATVLITVNVDEAMRRICQRGKAKHHENIPYLKKVQKLLVERIDACPNPILLNGEQDRQENVNQVLQKLGN